MAAVVDCFVLSFRAIAKGHHLEWTTLRCDAEGTLDRRERVTRFVGLRIEADLCLCAGGDAELAGRLLEKAEKTCLVSNSLDLEVTLEPRVTTEDPHPVSPS